MGQIIPFDRRAYVLNSDSSHISSIAPIAAFYTDVSGRLERASECWTRLTDCTLREAVGSGWLNAVHADERSYISKLWFDLVRTEQFVSMDFRLARKPMVVRLQALPQYDSDSCCTGYCGTLNSIEHNLGNLKHTPNFSPDENRNQFDSQPPELTAKIERLRKAIDIAGLFYFEHDLVNSTSYRSNPLRHLFGGNWSLRDLQDSLHPIDRNITAETYYRCKQHNCLYTSEFRVKFPKCETLRVRSIGLFSTDHDGNAISFFGFTIPAERWKANSESSSIEMLFRLAGASAE